MTYRLLEHTADLGIEASADSLDEIFAECLRALTDCLTRLDRVVSVKTRDLDLAAPDLPQLMVDFLSEAVYLHEAEGLVLADANVAVEKTPEGWSLSGVVSGETFDIERHGLKTLIKGVTYHQLSVQSHEGKWVARIIFDI